MLGCVQLALPVLRGQAWEEAKLAEPAEPVAPSFVASTKYWSDVVVVGTQIAGRTWTLGSTPPSSSKMRIVDLEIGRAHV